MQIAVVSDFQIGKIFVSISENLNLKFLHVERQISGVEFTNVFVNRKTRGPFYGRNLYGQYLPKHPVD